MPPSISPKRCGTCSAMTGCGPPRPTTSTSITSPSATTRCHPGSPHAKPSNKESREMLGIRPPQASPQLGRRHGQPKLLGALVVFVKRDHIGDGLFMTFIV